MFVLVCFMVFGVDLVGFGVCVLIVCWIVVVVLCLLVDDGCVLVDWVV